MKKTLLAIALFLCTTPFLNAQEDGVVSLAIPVRNSLKFNRYIINPTFSFVREQNKYITINNKREWVQFEDAPQTYLLSYSGRFKENIGLGIGLFQQNYGVLTSFGGVVNLAYNAMLQPDSNLTFGLNVGFYQSGINDGKVVTNTPDPSLENIPSNSILSISPGINYGTVFFDFGVSVNNLVQYNFKTSQLLKEDPQQNIQAHIMYTGYMSSYGFFDESKFSGLVKSEFKKDKTIFSGLAMLTVPKGVWAQLGYNTHYGISGGMGINITKQIAIEYNYEKAIGDLSAFGSSHDITLAYKFRNNNNYYYSGDDEEEALILPKKKKRKAIVSKPKVEKATNTKLAKEKLETKVKAEEEARLAAEALAQAQAEEEARLAADNQVEVKEDEKKIEQEVTHKDAIAKSMFEITESVKKSKEKQEELLSRLNNAIAIKDKDLKDLKEENDLSEQGIYLEPKPFKSISAENRALEALKLELDVAIDSRSKEIKDLEDAYKQRLKKVSSKTDKTNQYYFETIQTLKEEQAESERSKARMVSTLETIRIATEFERKRRIKRAAFDNEEDRYMKDRARLNRIKENTPLTDAPLTKEDFDYGEEQTSTVQILKDVQNVENGYYLIIAVHSDKDKRDDFLKKVVSTGQSNINFFFDVNSSKYFIYYQKFDYVDDAMRALESKGSMPYNGRMSVVKIEN